MRFIMFIVVLAIAVITRSRILARMDRARESIRGFPGVSSYGTWLMVRTLADFHSQLIIALVTCVAQFAGSSPRYLLSWLCASITMEAISYDTAREFVRRAPPFSPTDRAEFLGMQQWSVRLGRVAMASILVILVAIPGWNR